MVIRRDRGHKRLVYECLQCGDTTSDFDAFVVHAHLHLLTVAKPQGGKHRAARNRGGERRGLATDLSRVRHA